MISNESNSRSIWETSLFANVCKLDEVMIMVMLEMMMVLMMMGMMLGMMMQQVSNEANGRCAGISSGPNLLTLKSCTYLNSVHTYMLYILTFYILVYLHLVPNAC